MTTQVLTADKVRAAVSMPEVIDAGRAAFMINSSIIEESERVANVRDAER